MFGGDIVAAKSCRIKTIQSEHHKFTKSPVSCLAFIQLHVLMKSCTKINFGHDPGRRHSTEDIINLVFRFLFKATETATASFTIPAIQKSVKATNNNIAMTEA